MWSPPKFCIEMKRKTRRRINLFHVSISSVSTRSRSIFIFLVAATWRLWVLMCVCVCAPHSIMRWLFEAIQFIIWVNIYLIYLSKFAFTKWCMIWINYTFHHFEFFTAVVKNTFVYFTSHISQTGVDGRARVFQIVVIVDAVVVIVTVTVAVALLVIRNGVLVSAYLFNM